MTLKVEPLGDLGVLVLLLLLLMLMDEQKDIRVVEAINDGGGGDKGGVCLVGCRERTEQVGDGHVGRGSRRDK